MSRQADKPSLKDVVGKLSTADTSKIPTNVKYVLDGGSLLHKVQWTIGQIFKQICNDYIAYIQTRYSPDVTIVFDGRYMNSSTKDTTHIRRLNGYTGKRINLSLANKLSTKKASFLLNNANKQTFLFLLGNELQTAFMSVYHASGDADLLIVQTARKIAKVNTTVIVGEDTDLFVLALFHFNNHKALYLTSALRDSNVGQTKKCFGDTICHGLLVVHGVTGCDTISRIGKSSVFQKFRNDKEFQ